MTLTPATASLPEWASRPVVTETAAPQGITLKDRMQATLARHKSQAFYDTQVLANAFTAASGLLTGAYGRAVTGGLNMLSNIFNGRATREGLNRGYNQNAVQSGLMAFGMGRQAFQAASAVTKFELGAVATVMAAYAIKSLCYFRKYRKDRAGQKREIAENNAAFDGVAVSTVSEKQGVEHDRWQRTEDFMLRHGDNVFTGLFIARGTLQIADSIARFATTGDFDVNAFAGGALYIGSAMMERTQRRALERESRPNTKSAPGAPARSNQGIIP